MSEIIYIKGADVTKRLPQSHFICRYLATTQSNTIQKVVAHSMFQRGMAHSQYAYAYTDYVENRLGSTEFTDSFSRAIQQLHISVIPEKLPCRTEQRNVIEGHIRSGILGKGAQKGAMYICGMPGK